MAQRQSLTRNIAGFMLFLTLVISAILATALPHYLTDRALASGEVVELVLPLNKKNPEKNPAKVPWVYAFTVDGVDYEGSPFLSEEAIQGDPTTGEFFARVVYLKSNPAHHRMEPVSEAGGIRWVGIFPKVLVLALMLSGFACLAACWEHIVRIGGKGTARHATLVEDWAMILVNVSVAFTIIALPMAALGSLMGFMGSYDLYKGAAVPLAVVALVLLVWFIVAAKLGANLEGIIQQRLGGMAPTSSRRPKSARQLEVESLPPGTRY